MKIKEKFKRKLFHLFMVSAVVFPLFTGLFTIPQLEVQAQTLGEAELDRSETMYATVEWQGRTQTVLIARIYLDGQLVFCADPHTLVVEGEGYTSTGDFPFNARVNRLATLWDLAGDDFIHYAAAQIMIWEELGARIVNISGVNEAQMSAARNGINTVIEDYLRQPSFHDETVTLAIGQSIALTDMNNSDLVRFDELVENTANVDFSINGNNLVIIANENSVSGALRLATGFRVGTPFLWIKDGSQDLISEGIQDPNFFLVNLNIIRTGAVEVLKRDIENHQVVPGTRFRIDYTNEQGNSANREITTGANGIARMEGVLHGTRPRLTEVFVPAPYVLDPTPFYAPTVVAGDTVSAMQENRRQKGQIQVQKYGERSGLEMWNSHYNDYNMIQFTGH